MYDTVRLFARLHGVSRKITTKPGLKRNPRVWSKKGESKAGVWCFDFGLKEGKLHNQGVIQGGEDSEGHRLESRLLWRVGTWQELM